MENIISNTNLIEKPSKLIRITPYIFFFFIFSFIGWVLETIFCYCLYGIIMERGFLYAPICPIYRNRCIYSYCLFR